MVSQHVLHKPHIYTFMGSASIILSGFIVKGMIKDENKLNDV
jgi:hypothetical protein